MRRLTSVLLVVELLFSASAFAQTPFDSPQRSIGPSATPCKSIEGFDPRDRERYFPWLYKAGSVTNPVHCIEWLDMNQGWCQVTTECRDS